MSEVFWEIIRVGFIPCVIFAVLMFGLMCLGMYIGTKIGTYVQKKKEAKAHKDCITINIPPAGPDKL